jgi:hypothetical protein
MLSIDQQHLGPNDSGSHVTRWIVIAVIAAAAVVGVVLLVMYGGGGGGSGPGY